MRKSHQCCMVAIAVIIICLILYLPLLLSIRSPLTFDWNMSRDLRVYVRPDNVTSLIGAETMCVTEHDIFLVIVVCSAVPNFEARNAIRETWGSVVANYSSKLVFLLGRPANDTLQDEVQHESNVYADIVQEDFVDTYHNLTLKSVMLLKWVDAMCRHARYVMKTDDDMFVHVANLAKLLHKHGRPRLLLGSLICGAIPIKDKKSKWYSPNSMFAERVYPNYLSGTGYVVSQDLVPLLYDAALDTPFFHMEDIYVTGILARKLKLRPQDHVAFSYQRRPMNPCLFRLIVTGHRMTPSNLQNIWKQLNDPGLTCEKKRLRIRDYTPLRC